MLLKQENILFIVLLVAAAIVLGTTIGIINNMHYLVKHTAKTKTSQVTPVVHPDQPAAAKNAPTAEKKPVEESPSVDAATRAENMEAAKSNHILTPTEVSEIVSMLKELGYNDATLNASVRAFQHQNQITTNGTLDNETLEQIIQELTLKKARALAY